MFDFAKNQNVASLDAVPENLQVFYLPNEGDDGGFNLRDDEVTKGAISVIAGQGKSLLASRAEAKGLKGKSVDLSALGAYGATPEEIASGIATKIEELQTLADSKGANTVDVEKMKKEMIAAAEAARQGDLSRITQLEGQIHTSLVSTEFVKAVGKPEPAAYLQKIYADQVQVRTLDNGSSVAVVVDSGGEPRYNGVGEPMNISELMAEAKLNPVTARLFDSERPAGGDIKPGQAQRVDGNRRPGTPGGKAELTSTEKIQAGLKSTFGAGRST